MSKTFMACLALVAVFAAVASASPIKADLALGAGFGDNCLNKTQKDELRKITDGIKITLNTAVVSLDIAAAAEKDPKTKQNLELAAKIINAVNVELVSNLSKIADEACGTCSQITKAVNDSITALEQALEKIEPDWKKNPIFEDVVKALSDIIGLVEALCPTGACARAQLRLRDSCLNATQLAELKKAIDGIQILIKTADLALLIAARAESDPKTKQDLLTVEKVLSSVSDELLANLTSLLSQPCASCKQVTALVGDFITTIENTLAKIDPDWTKDPLWKEVVDALNQIVSLVEDICPSRVAYAAPLKHMQLHR